MTALPSGTVTLLFTDIEGSSKLWDEHRSAMAVALAEHNRILTDAITEHGGVIVKDEGLRLLGASETTLAKLEVGYWPGLDLLLDQRLAPLRERIGDDTADARIAEGRIMSFQDIKERTTSLLDQI